MMIFLEIFLLIFVLASKSTKQQKAKPTKTNAITGVIQTLTFFRFDIFREIKQLLHIKTFIGTSENAVMIQIWTAMITILVLKALKAMAKHKWYLSNLVAFIRLNIFVKVDLQQWLDHPFEEQPPPEPKVVQGVLF